MKLLSLLVLSLGFCTSVFAEPWTGEAEAGAVMVTGNAKSESYALKANTSYKQEFNIYRLSGRYLNTTANDVEISRHWEGGVRYERTLSDRFSVYIGQKYEGDIFNGYRQRDSSDLGAKHFLVKEGDQSWFVELGYRYQKTQPTTCCTTYDNLLRVYTEVNKKIEDNLSLRFWVEHLPNFTQPDAYLTNSEASMNIMLSKVFSTKLAYLLQYQNTPPSGGKYTTTTTTMNLVAKF